MAANGNLSVVVVQCFLLHRPHLAAVPVAAQSWMVRAMPANVEGGLALFVSALQGSLAAGSAAGGVIYDAKGPGGALAVAAAVATAGSLTLLGRAGAAISSPPAGSADLARERGREVPAPSRGAIDTAGNGNSVQRAR